MPVIFVAGGLSWGGCTLLGAHPCSSCACCVGSSGGVQCMPPCNTSVSGLSLVYLWCCRCASQSARRSRNRFQITGSQTSKIVTLLYYTCSTH
ncbi:hypothetical protein COO60DRAFT_219900 [Scenedesmus sp. NREL 46B-D3]|nr:hypothetical protein COO60DRAFT_219900 [Scenedesmus sp. NREL 46B-D3]